MTRIEEIKARLAKITPGKWKFKHSGNMHGSSIELDNGGVLAVTTSYGRMREDAQFIAQAPSDVAYLLERIEALEAKQTDLKYCDNSGALLGNGDEIKQ